MFCKGSLSKFLFLLWFGKDFLLFKKGFGSIINLLVDKNEFWVSIGDFDDLGEEGGGVVVLGWSYDSVISSLLLGFVRIWDSKESCISSWWGFLMKKKGKDMLSREKESLDMECVLDEE